MHELQECGEERERGRTVKFRRLMRDEGRKHFVHTGSGVCQFVPVLYLYYSHKVNSGLGFFFFLALYGYSWGYVQV